MAFDHLTSACQMDKLKLCPYDIHSISFAGFCTAGAGHIKLLTTVLLNKSLFCSYIVTVIIVVNSKICDCDW